MNKENERVELVAKDGCIYTINGKPVAYVAKTQRLRDLCNNDGWERDKESWLSYRERTKKERESEAEKSNKLACDLVDAYNKCFIENRK